MGVISIKTSERNGEQIGAVRVDEDDEIMLITDGGTLVRTRVADVSVVGRNTQGVTLIRLSKDENLVGIERIAALEGEDATKSKTKSTVPGRMQTMTGAGSARSMPSFPGRRGRAAERRADRPAG